MTTPTADLVAMQYGNPDYVAVPAGPYTHGRDCPKIPHTSETFGYMHMDTDDSPFDDDGLTYCGRCHVWLPK